MEFRPQPSLWRKVIGWIFMAIGLLGIVLPIIPGIPFLILGLVMLATQHRWAHALLIWGKSRFRSAWNRHRSSAEAKRS